MVLDDGGFARTYPVIDHRRPKLLKNTTKTTRRAACWRLITDLRRDNVPPGRISVLLLKTPRGDEEKHLERMGLRRLSEKDVPHLRGNVARADAQPQPIPADNTSEPDCERLTQPDLRCSL